MVFFGFFFLDFFFRNRPLPKKKFFFFFGEKFCDVEKKKFFLGGREAWEAGPPGREAWASSEPCHRRSSSDVSKIHIFLPNFAKYRNSYFPPSRQSPRDPLREVRAARGPKARGRPDLPKGNPEGQGREGCSFVTRRGRFLPELPANKRFCGVLCTNT